MAFARIQDGAGLPPGLRGGVVAVGNFDGMHRGHQSVFGLAMQRAGERNAPALILTFEPHPQKIFAPAKPLFRLTPAPMKAALAEKLGLDGIVELPFTHGFTGLSPDEFVRTILVEGLGVSHVVTGADFHYGKDRAGNTATLAAAGSRCGFGTDVAPTFTDEGGETISSTRIRRQLSDGEPAEAAGLLGYRYTVEAVVGGGKQLGRTLGFPTANMALPEEAGLAHGIYAVRLRRADGTLHDGVASFGRRPTVDVDGAPLLETYVFDFSGDLYGETCRVSLFGFLRGEEKFSSLDALTAQMRRDEDEARAVLAGVKPLSGLDAAVAF